MTASSVTLREITRENLRECIGLKVRPDQQTFVASNMYSLAEAKVDPSLEPRAVYAGESMVGFTMYGRDPADGTHWVVRLMVDERYQRRGYGRAAMLAVIDHLRAYPDCHEIYIGHQPENSVADGLYLSLGFEHDGIVDGEVRMRLRL